MAFSFFARSNIENDVSVLAAATGLLDEFTLANSGFSNCLAVSDLRFTDATLDFKFTLHAVDDDFEVKLTHTGNNGLAGFFVGFNNESRVFIGKACESE